MLLKLPPEGVSSRLNGRFWSARWVPDEHVSLHRITPCSAMPSSSRWNMKPFVWLCPRKPELLSTYCSVDAELLLLGRKEYVERTVLKSFQMKPKNCLPISGCCQGEENVFFPSSLPFSIWLFKPERLWFTFHSNFTKIQSTKNNFCNILSVKRNQAM